VVYRSIRTVKADAARRSFPELGQGIVWAVLGSGVDASHSHFARYDNLGGDVAGMHRDFVDGTGEGPGKSLIDPHGFGTHAAGIVAGSLGATYPTRSVAVFEEGQGVGGLAEVTRSQVEPGDISGLAPQCKIVSFRVVEDDGSRQVSSVLKALQHVREINGDGRYIRIHGVLIPLGFAFDPRRFACGASPLCLEVDRLVSIGVCVVVAAGNTGRARMNGLEGATESGVMVTINDPGNAEMAITVGSTHRDMPHRYGVSYFSSKGPTADGRSKPDLVAPGESVTSAVAGQLRATLPYKGKSKAVYASQSGTSVASAHVAGVAAGFLSVNREFVGRPTEVKRILLDSATSLGRREEFQGRGLVDLMRALQSV
jgi:serine protease AprX